MKRFIIRTGVQHYCGAYVTIVTAKLPAFKLSWVDQIIRDCEPHLVRSFLSEDQVQSYGLLPEGNSIKIYWIRNATFFT